MKLPSEVLVLVSLLLATSVVGDSTSRRTSTAVDPAGSALVYVRVKGQPDICLVSPDGKSIRASKGVVLQNDFPGQAEAYSVPPTTQLALKDPPSGRWRLRIRGNEERRLVVSVLRSLANGGLTCDAADTVLVKGNESRWWDVRWSDSQEHDSCWVDLTRAQQDRSRKK